MLLDIGFWYINQLELLTFFTVGQSYAKFYDINSSRYCYQKMFDPGYIQFNQNWSKIKN